MNIARPQSKLSLTDKVQLFVRAWCMAREQKVGGLPFCMDSEPVTANDLSDPDTLLPVIGWHCARIYTSSGFKSPMAVDYPRRQASLLKHSVRFDRFSRPDAELMLFLAEALEDAANNLPRLDPNRPAVNIRLLTEQFVSAMANPRPNSNSKPVTT